MKALVASLVLLLLINLSAFSQASLASEDIIDEVPINNQGIEEKFTLVRDARARNQWYYVPNMPRVFEKVVNGVKEPEFSLTKYQFMHPQKPDQVLEGGILQFSSTLQIPDAASNMLRQYIESKYNSQVAIRLSPLPIKGATVALYAPGDVNLSDSCRLISSNIWGNGIAPTFTSQKMAFSMSLSAIGSDVMQKITDGNSGIPMAVIFSYNGLTPKAGFKVKVDWDRTYSHYSNNKEIRSSASYYGLFGASYSRSSQDIANNLIANKCIEIEVISGENFNMTDIDKYLQPILARINSELLADFTPTPQIDPAVAKEPTASGKFFSAGYSVAMKHNTNQKHGSETIDMSVQQIIERKTIASGFIGINSYSDDIKRKLIEIVPELSFKKAYLILPTPYSKNTAESMEIENIYFESSLKNLIDGKSTNSQVVKWDPSYDTWLTQTIDTPKPIRYILHPLLNEWNTSNSLENFVFLNKVTFNFKNDQPIEIVSQDKAFDGQRLVNSYKEVGFEKIEIDPSYLHFKRIDNNSSLIQVNISVEYNGKTINRIIKPIKTNNVYQNPDVMVIMFEKSGPTPVVTNISFELEGGITKNARLNGQNLRAVKPNLYLVLNDTEWK